ncbi:MAG: sigma-E factor negative regulatory protein [Thiogranum sp.]|nr:sigma-E factor negative regulatory protein [Thiogranum sp.]
MSDEIREQVSALLDDELSADERPLLLARLQRDAELAECLGRYELIGEVMRGGGNSAALGIARQVQTALADEQPLAAGKSVAARRALALWKPVAGIAVAASVALVAILTVTSVRDNAPDPVPAMAVVDSKAPLVAEAASGGELQWNRIEPRIDKRLSGYLVNHNEYAANRGVQGVMPYVRIVGFENSQQ